MPVRAHARLLIFEMSDGEGGVIILALKITALWLALRFILALAIGRMIRARDELQLTEADIYDPRITELLFPARQGGSCSRGGESHVRTAPAASLIKLRHRGESSRG